jgi:hypothetical protein
MSMLLTGVGRHQVPAGGSWTPASLGSALIGWYNADSANVSPNTNGSTVTVMTDLSGNGHNMAPNGFTGPTYNTTGLGGKPSLDFVGGNTSGMRTTADVVALGTGTTSSIFILAKASATGSLKGPYIAANGEVGTYTQTSKSWALSMDGSGPTLEATAANGTWGSSTFTVNTEGRYGVINDGTNFTPYINNVAGTPATKTITFATPGSLGASGGQFDGSIREIIFTNTALSSGDRASLDAYLVSRS